jgi:hypothetical protein
LLGDSCACIRQLWALFVNPSQCLVLVLPIPVPLLTIAVGLKFAVPETDQSDTSFLSTNHRHRKLLVNKGNAILTKSSKSPG